MNKRVYKRHFDWDEAKRMYDEGIPISWIAAKFKVSSSAIQRIVRPGERERQAAYIRSVSIGKSSCIDCGTPTNRLSRSSGRCRNCADKLRRKSVREGELRCSACGEWKPDEMFHHSSEKAHASRRARRDDCKVCSNRRRSEFRNRARIPCKGGCGRLISVIDQRSQEKRRGTYNVTLGYCPWCSPSNPWRLRMGEDEKHNKLVKDNAIGFRKKFGQTSKQTGTTED